jgi:GNAT superfamily N-acetyltransferase
VVYPVCYVLYVALSTLYLFVPGGRTNHENCGLANIASKVMEILAVHPAYQRRGLGSQMLEPILGLADRERRKIYIEASKKGVGLFRQYGWVQVDALLLDTRPYGGGEHRGDGADDTGARVRENDCCVRRGDTVVSRVHQI